MKTGLGKKRKKGCEKDLLEVITDRLDLLFDQQEIIMKTIAEVVAEIAVVKTGLTENVAKQKTYFEKVLAAVNRLEAKIAAGADGQAAFDALQPFKQELADASTELGLKSAEVDAVGA